MVAWALSALEAQTPQLWAAELAFISACPAGSMDEVIWVLPTVQQRQTLHGMPAAAQV